MVLTYLHFRNLKISHVGRLAPHGRSGSTQRSMLKLARLEGRRHHLWYLVVVMFIEHSVKHVQAPSTTIRSWFVCVWKCCKSSVNPTHSNYNYTYKLLVGKTTSQNHMKTDCTTTNTGHDSPWSPLELGLAPPGLPLALDQAAPLARQLQPLILGGGSYNAKLAQPNQHVISYIHPSIHPSIYPSIYLSNLI